MNIEGIMRWLESTEKVFKEVADAIGGNINSVFIYAQSTGVCA